MILEKALHAYAKENPDEAERALAELHMRPDRQKLWIEGDDPGLDPDPWDTHSHIKIKGTIDFESS